MEVTLVISKNIVHWLIEKLLVNNPIDILSLAKVLYSRFLDTNDGSITITNTEGKLSIKVKVDDNSNKHENYHNV